MAKKFDGPVIKVLNLEEITHKVGLKIIAITDESLGKAIINHKENGNLG